MEADKGYAWVIFLASFFCLVLQGGMVYSVGVFYQLFLQHFGETNKAVLALICSLNMGAYCVVGPLSAILCNKFGCRTVSMVGSLLGALGIILSSFVNNIIFLALTFGLMAGMILHNLREGDGNTAIYNSGATAASQSLWVMVSSMGNWPIRACFTN